MVVDEGQDLLEVEVLLLALHTQIVEGEMDDVHPAGVTKARGQQPTPSAMSSTAHSRRYGTTVVGSVMAQSTAPLCLRDGDIPKKQAP